MKVIIVYAHPYDGSYNRALLESALEGLKSGGHEIDLIDLYKDGFNPVMSEEDLYNASKAQVKDETIIEYQNRINSSEHIIFMFPIWYESMPAIMKGFVDRVFSNGWAYKTVDGKKMPEGQLSHLRATVVSTMGVPSLVYKLFLNNAVQGVLIKGVLNFSGIKNVKWHRIDNIQNISKAKRIKWLESIKLYAHSLS